MDEIESLKNLLKLKRLHINYLKTNTQKTNTQNNSIKQL